MSLSYGEYVKMQIYGEIIKPIHYHIGEWIAMNTLITGWDDSAKVLDVGCGIGYGVGMFRKLGFKNVLGIDLNPKKIDLGKRLGYPILEKDITEIDADEYDIVWCSHSFEHMYDPDLALEVMKKITTDEARLYFILPYPDINPSPVHHSAPIIGTNINDGWRTVIKWFESRGLRTTFEASSSFREPEIWLEFSKV